MLRAEIKKRKKEGRKKGGRVVSRAWYDTIAQRAAIVRRWWRVRERSGESVLRTFRAIISSFRTRSTRTTKVTHFSGKSACTRIRSNQVFHARLKTTTTTKGESKLGYGGRICRGPRYRIIPVTSVERCSEPFKIPFLLPLPPALHPRRHSRDTFQSSVVILLPPYV